MNIKRYVSAGFGMIPADDGEWVMWSELEPVVKRAIDNAKDSGILAGSIIADDNAKELEELKKRLHDISLALVVAEGENLRIGKALSFATKTLEDIRDDGCPVAAKDMAASAVTFVLLAMMRAKGTKALPTTTEGEK